MSEEAKQVCEIIAKPIRKRRLKSIKNFQELTLRDLKRADEIEKLFRDFYKIRNENNASR